MKSGKVVGAEYVQTFRTYLESVDALPRNEDGALSISAIAEASGIPRQSFYKNPQLKALLADVKVELPVKAFQEGATSNSRRVRSEGGLDTKAKLLERRVHQLEQQNAALVAENAELRRQLKALRLQAAREDMIIETGQRIPAPPERHV